MTTRQLGHKVLRAAEFNLWRGFDNLKRHLLRTHHPQTIEGHDAEICDHCALLKITNEVAPEVKERLARILAG